MRSLRLIVSLAATGLLLAACGNSAKKDAQAPTSSNRASSPNSSRGLKDTGTGTAKSGGVAEARTGTYLQSRGLAQALNDLRSALVQKGKLDKEAAGTASVAGTEGTALISAANLRQGLTPAQSLDRIEAARRLALTGTSKVPAHSTLRAAQGEALELTSPAQLHAGISQAAAIRRLSAFAAASSIGINARGGIVTLKQARGQASVDDSAGTLQAGAAGATFRNAPSAAQTLAALAKRMPGQIRRR